MTNRGHGAWRGANDEGMALYLVIGFLAALMIASGECGRCARYDPEGLYIDAQALGGYSGNVPGYCN